MISIKGLDKAAVLAALYNAARPQGMGFMRFDPKPMTVEEARGVLAQQQDFDYLQGRVMKVNLSGDEFDPQWYDRDNGEDAALQAIEAMGITGDVNDIAIRAQHASGTQAAAEIVLDHLDEESGWEVPRSDGLRVYGLGFSEVADVLELQVEKARQATPSPLGSDPNELVQLNNGDEVPRSLVNVTMMALETLFTTAPIEFFELREICRDPKHRCFGRTGETLRSRCLLEGNGQPHDAVRSIVLSAVEGEMLEMRLRWPINQDSPS